MSLGWRSGIAGVLITGLLAVLAGQQLLTPGLRDSFPAGVPDTTGWETSSGAAEFGRPDHTVEYKLYVSPERGAFYALTRYRIVFADPEERARRGITADEKLQWDVDGKTVRRYACVGAERASEPCEWSEMARGSDDYNRETGNLLMIFGLHRKLLYERDHPEEAR